MQAELIREMKPKGGFKMQKKDTKQFIQLDQIFWLHLPLCCEDKRCRSSPEKALLHSGGLQVVIISQLFYKGTCYSSPYMLKDCLWHQFLVDYANKEGWRLPNSDEKKQ